jgi:hypothetical protein
MPGALPLSYVMNWDCVSTRYIDKLRLQQFLAAIKHSSTHGRVAQLAILKGLPVHQATIRISELGAALRLWVHFLHKFARRKFSPYVIVELYNLGVINRNV